MDPLELKDRWVLVTGASSGLGEAMARDLAKRHGANVLLVARRKDRLESLATEIRSAGRQADVFAADLSDIAAARTLFDEVTSRHTVHGAILNAGQTYFGDALALDFEAFDKLLSLNVRSLVLLAQQFVPHIATRSPGGGVMLVSSLTGFSPTPFQAAYSGTKAFINHWGLALADEISHMPVSLTVCVPGGIATEMTANSGIGKKFNADSVGMMHAHDVAARSLDAWRRRRKVYIPGALNKTLDALGRVMPRAFWTRRVGAVYRDIPRDGT